MKKEVEILLNKVTKDSCDCIAQELAELKEGIPLLIKLFPSLTEIQKIAVIQVGLYSNSKYLVKFIKQVTESDELFFIREVAIGVLEINQQKNEENYANSIMKRFHKRRDEEKITDLATLGSLKSVDVLHFLNSVYSNNPNVNEQKEIAKLQVMNGIEAVIEEYKHRKNYSIRGLREALYNSLPDEKIVKIILNDLFKEDKETLVDTTTILLYEPRIPRNVIDMNVINRLLDIIKGDYSVIIKENSLSILKREVKVNKYIKSELLEIYNSKKYLKSNNIISIIKNRDLTNLFKEILGI